MQPGDRGVATTAGRQAVRPVTSVVLLVAFAVAVLGVLGLTVVAPLQDRTRDALVPAAPAFGVVLLVVVLHSTSMVVSTSVGVVVVLGVAAALLLVATRRRRPPWRISQSAWVWAAVGLIAGSASAAVALQPTATAGDSRVVSPNASHDAFYYVSVSEWLTNHPASDIPDIGSGPGYGDALPVDGPAASSLMMHLRIGQELVQSFLNVMSHTSATDTFTPWLATWLLIVPGACIGVAGLLGWSRVSGLLLGVLVSTSVVVMQQVYTQNAASILGIALAPVVLACVIVAVDPVRRGSIILGAAGLAGLVGTYHELAPIVAPAVMGAVLVRRPATITHAVARAAALVGTAVVLAPMAWYRAALFLLGVESGFDALPSPFLQAPRQVIVNRLVGTAPASGGEQHSAVAPVLVVLIVVGLLAALVLSRDRGAWLGLLLGGFGLVAVLSAEQRGYTQRRAVEILVPLVLVVVAAGWDAALRRWPRERRAARVLGAGVASGLLVAVGVWAAVNVRSADAAFDPADVPARHVDDSFAEAAQWVTDVGGRGGEAVTVLVPNFFDQLWISRALAGESMVSYPGLFPDYLRVQQFWGGEVDRYLLVGRGTQVDSEESAIVASNERFTLLDLQAGEALVVSPVQMTHWHPHADVSGSMTTVDDGAALVLRTPGSAPVMGLELRVGASQELPVRVDVAGQEVTALLDSQPTWVPVRLPECCVPAMIVIDDALPSDEPAGQDLSIQLLGVRRE